MNENDFATYKTEGTPAATPVLIHADEVPGDDRTLVYGYSRAYDADFNESTYTVHAYKRDGELHVVFYNYEGTRIHAASGRSLPIEDFIPQKRAYPERCDLGFARLLRAKGHPLCFTTFGGAGSNSEGTFAGRFIEDTTISTVNAL